MTDKKPSKKVSKKAEPVTSPPPEAKVVKAKALKSKKSVAQKADQVSADLTLEQANSLLREKEQKVLHQSDVNLLTGIQGVSPVFSTKKAQKNSRKGESKTSMTGEMPTSNKSTTAKDAVAKAMQEANLVLIEMDSSVLNPADAKLLTNIPGVGPVFSTDKAQESSQKGQNKTPATDSVTKAFQDLCFVINVRLISKKMQVVDLAQSLVKKVKKAFSKPVDMTHKQSRSLTKISSEKAKKND
jgi:hypothetical protein